VSWQFEDGGGKVGRGDHVGARLAQPARELATNASYDRETQIRLTTGSRGISIYQVRYLEARGGESSPLHLGDGANRVGLSSVCIERWTFKQRSIFCASKFVCSFFLHPRKLNTKKCKTIEPTTKSANALEKAFREDTV
jgi:hypothetical protein